MSKKKAASKEVYNVDVLWDSWLDGVKKVNELQKEYEVESLKALNNLGELLKPTNEMIQEAEKESIEFTKTLNKTLKENMSASAQGEESFNSYWLNQVEAVSNHTQNLFWNSNKTVFDFISKSQEQLSSNTESVLKEKQKIRTEMIKTIEGLVDEIKDTQKAALSTK